MNRLTPWCKTLKNLPLTPKSTKTALTENCNIFCDDVVFELGSVSPIKEDDKCVGYRVMIKVKYETILTSLSIPS